MEQGFPDSHTTGTYGSGPSGGGKMAAVLQYFDFSYLPSPPGLLKCAQLFLALIGFICSEVSAMFPSTANWFSFVSMAGFWITLLLLLAYLLHAFDKIPVPVPWTLAEFCYCALWSFLYFTAACACASKGGSEEAMAAAAFFGFVLMILYGADAFLKFKAWKSGAAVGAQMGSQPMGGGATVGGVQSPTSPNNYPAY